MKIKSNPFLRKSASLVLAVSLTALCAFQSARADIYYWDGGVANLGAGNGASGGTAGTWNTTIQNWDNGPAHVAWPNSTADTAVFGGTAGAVTISGTISVGKVEVNTTSYTFQSGTLNFNSGIVDIAGTNINRATFSGSLAGSLTMNSTGNNTTSSTNTLATITGNNTSLTSFTLNLSNAASSVQLENAGALGAANATVKITKGQLTLNNGATTTYNAWATEFAGGTLRNRGNNIGNFTNTYAGNGTVTASSTISSLSTNLLVYSGTMDLGAASNTLTLVPGTGGKITFSNLISGSGNLVINTNGIDSGVGTVVLSAANTFTGSATTTVTRGTLELKHFNALQNATLDTGSGVGTQAVTFTAGTGTYNLGALQGADELAIGGNTISVGSKAVNTTFTGEISGSGGSLTKVGANTLILSQPNTYTGATTISAGILSVGTLANGSSASGIGQSTAAASNMIFDGGTLQYTGASVVSDRAFTINTGKTATIEVTSGTANLSLLGATGATTNGALTKSGSGTLTLTGTNTYTGATNVTGGSLVINGNISTSNLTTISSGATISGSGSVGALTVLSGGFVAPGNSAGILNTKDYVQSGNYNAELTGTSAGAGYDQIKVTGTVNVTGGSLITSFNTFTPVNGNLLFILLNDSNDAITGTYSGYAQGAVVASYGGFDWQISYTANGDSLGSPTFTGGNDIALMAIPEPNVAALIGGFGVLALLRRRRVG